MGVGNALALGVKYAAVDRFQREAARAVEHGLQGAGEICITRYKLDAVQFLGFAVESPQHTGSRFLILYGALPPGAAGGWPPGPFWSS